MSRRSVLFVCTGNTCRSPMAEQIFTQLAREAGLDWTASSAGTHAVPGMPASRGACEVLATRGLDPKEHRSRLVDAEMLAGADAVYVMERAHLEGLASRFPISAAKVALLDPNGIADPVGGHAAQFEAAAAAIEAAIKRIILTEKETYASNSR